MVFQSTPAHGGRLFSPQQQPQQPSFQSTPAHGGRPRYTAPDSIHRSFNPRPHTAGDPDTCPDILKASISFNPRPHTAGDMRRILRLGRVMSFNPRPHTAGDLQETLSAVGKDVSIHARTRRATLKLSAATADDNSFNPRPHTAGDYNRPAAVCKAGKFQSTPAHGGRLCRSMDIMKNV